MTKCTWKITDSKISCVKNHINWTLVKWKEKYKKVKKKKKLNILLDFQTNTFKGISRQSMEWVENFILLIFLLINTGHMKIIAG